MLREVAGPGWIFADVISLCVFCLHEDLVPGEKMSLWKFLQVIRSVGPQVLMAYSVLCCSRCWEYGLKRRNRAPGFLEFTFCLEDTANKQINKNWSDSSKCYDKNRTARWDGGEGVALGFMIRAICPERQLLGCYLSDNKAAVRPTPGERIFQAQLPAHREP